MTDFHLYLPENYGMTKIAIVPKFKDIHPLIQRAVCLLVAHEDEGLKVNGLPILIFAEQATNSNTSVLAQMLSPVADRLAELLNDEQPTASSVEFLVNSTDGRLFVDINITPVGSESGVSSNIYSR